MKSESLPPICGLESKIKELVNRGSEVYYHDKFIKNLNIKSKKKIIKINSVKIEKTNLLISKNNL